MSLRRLEYFVAVAEELSFTRAARTLHMAQPPLSTQIRELERELGAALFHRGARGITLTPAGVALLPEARRLLDRYGSLGRVVRLADTGATGRLAVGLVPSAANGRLPGVLALFREQHPGVDLSLVEDRPPQLLRRLDAEEVDVVLQYGESDNARHAAAVVAREAWLVALPADHPLAARRRVPVRALRDVPLILPPRHTAEGLYERIVRTLAEHDVTPRIVHGDVWQMQTIAGLVSAGLGAALVPSSTAVIRAGEVAYRPLSTRIDPVPLHVVWRADDRPPTVARFVELW